KFRSVLTLAERVFEMNAALTTPLSPNMNSSTSPFESNGTFTGSSLNYGRLPLMIFDFLLSTTASIANSLLLLTIYKDPHRSLRSPSTNLVINMAVADLMVGFLSGYLILAFDALLFMGKSTNVLRIQNFVSVHLVIGVASVIVGCCNVVAMACDRWLAVSSALNYRTIVTAKRINVLIVLFWIYAVVFTSLLFYPEIPLDIYDLLYCHLHVSLPLFALPLVYWKTFRALGAHTRRMANLGPGNERMNAKTLQGEKKTTKAFVIILCLFYVAFVPYVVAVNVTHFCSVCAVSKGFQDFVKISIRFIILNCSLDPFVYAWRIPKYRRAVRTVLIRYCRFMRRNNVIDQR
ncbi:hypothetical protein OS493_031246, partial [Desmophyllum pertusum]